eukprot:311064_1
MIHFAIFYLDITTALYLSLNTFNWLQAEDYCQKRCNSHLISLHNDQQYKQLINLIKNATNDYITTINPKTNTWIGLNDFDANQQWEWIDQTPFDFGNDISGGVYPWSTGDPGNSAVKSCILMEGIDIDGDYLWNDKVNSKIDCMFACNTCDGIVSKYVTITTLKNHTQSDEKCRQTFGTELANIHTYTDLLEAQLLCNLTNMQESVTAVNDCYIGSDLSLNVWHNFTTEIWNGIQINDCTCLNHSNKYNLSDTKCDIPKFFICNMPSEICYKNKWEVIAGFWNWRLNPCELVSNYSAINIAMITDRMWLNDPDNGMVLEYMYQMHGINGKVFDSGIIIYMDTNGYMYYYIGISKTFNYVFIAKVKDNNQYDIIKSKQLDFEYMFGTYYLLQIKLINGTQFLIGVNGKHYLNVIHNEFDNFRNERSGFIGLRSTSSNVIAKSLFLSGRLLYTMFNKTCMSTEVLNKGNGISVEIKFQFDLKIHVNVTNILINITKTVIEQEIDIYSVCIDDEKFNIRINVNNTNNVSSAIITSEIYGCTEDEQDILIAIFNPQQLNKSFIGNTQDNPILYVYPNSVEINVDIIDSITTTLIETTMKIDKKMPSEDDKLFKISIILMVVVVLLCCIIWSLITLIFWIKNKRKDKQSNMHIVRNVSNELDIIEMETALPTIGSVFFSDTKGLHIIRNDTGSGGNQQDKNDGHNDTDDDLYDDPLTNNTPHATPFVDENVNTATECV